MQNINRLERVKKLRAPTEQQPLRILSSACLLGVLCGYDGTSYGKYPHILDLRRNPRAEVHQFCPEDLSFGTPRKLCDIHGGDGLDVLYGKARVLTADGEDWTEGMIAASEKMLAVAREKEIELCILMDISAACGSHVIYNGNREREDSTYRQGAGVCAAQLMRHGFPVICQRDYASLEALFSKINPMHEPDPSAVDHDHTEWYRTYFK